MHFFNWDKTKTFLKSLHTCLPLIIPLFSSGPISGFAVNYYGFRPVLLVGVASSTLGIVSSAFVNSLNWLYITYGIVAGKYVYAHIHKYIHCPPQLNIVPNSITDFRRP